jgi:hypothetical protein
MNLHGEEQEEDAEKTILKGPAICDDKKKSWR